MSARRKATRSMFMHTLGMRPAFYDGRQVCYAQQGRWARKGLVLVATVEQIREEQRASSDWRLERGYSEDFAEYGYCRVEVPR